MQFVGKKIFPNNSWAKINSLPIALAKENFKLSQVVPVVVTKIDTLIDLGEDNLPGRQYRAKRW